MLPQTLTHGLSIAAGSIVDFHDGKPLLVVARSFNDLFLAQESEFYSFTLKLLFILNIKLFNLVLVRPFFANGTFDILALVAHGRESHWESDSRADDFFL